MKVAGIILVLLLPVQFAAIEQTYGEFTVEMEQSDLVVGATCFGSNSGSPDTTRIPCEVSPGSVSTFICLSSCLLSTSYVLLTNEGNISAAVFNLTATLVVHAALHENCTSAEGCRWIIGLSEKFVESQCINVYVADSITSQPALRGIKKRIWMGSRDKTDDLSTVKQLPRCLMNNGELFHWNTVSSGDCSSESGIFFSTGIYLVSATEVFVTSNNSILYSPCRGCIWYHLRLPSSTNITSLQYINDLFYVLLTVKNGEAEVLMGIAGVSPPLPVYPCPSLQWIWNRDLAELNSFLLSASLTVDTHGRLVARNGEEDMLLPYSLLLSQAFYEYLSEQTNSTLLPSLQLSYNDDMVSLEERPHPLLRLPQIYRLCPLSDVVVEAPVCDQITRSVIEIENVKLFGDSLPWINCSEMSDSLPTEIFLRRRESYVFIVHLLLNPLLAAEIDVDELKLVHTQSVPDAIEVLAEDHHHASNNTIQYKVTLKEKAETVLQTQVAPATIIHSVNINFQISGIGLECLKPLDPRPYIPGRLQTRVHIGCPPGLSLVFDHLTTQAHSNQFCTPSNNISCYYFGNDFHPALQLVDAVTDERSTYTGPYTLRILAGGISRANMKSINPSVQTDIWTAAVDDVMRHDSNKIEWTCGLGSPCGEVLPSSQGSPEYFLLIQASNRVVDGAETYCDLTVEFIIRLHGLSMGPITTSITLIVLLLLWVVSVVTLFLLWLWREKKEMAGRWRLVDWYKRWYGRLIQLYSRLREWVKEMVRRFQQTQRPVEPHMHTD